MKPELINEQDVEKEMEDIGVDSDGIKLMLPKSEFRIIKLYGIRNAMANILKQEMLSLGGDVAVHKGCVNCTVSKSDILIMGTMKQITDLVKKMYAQVSEGKEIAKSIKNFIEK